MQKNEEKKVSILEALFHIEDLYLKLLSYLRIEDLLSLSRISKEYHLVCSSIHVWKQLLRQDFNWPPKVRRGKGRKKEAKEKKLEPTLTELKAVYIQRWKQKIPDSSDEVLKSGLLRMLARVYIRYQNYLGPVCKHAIKIMPEKARKPSYIGCVRCKYIVDLAGLTRAQMLEVLRTEGTETESALKLITGRVLSTRIGSQLDFKTTPYK